jgi:3-dehydroquinate dehydratase-2
MASILALHGPNLNLLGSREPHIYGSDTLDDINQRLATKSTESGHQFDSLQANSEGEIIDRLHAAQKDGTAFMIVNFGGFTHTSIPSSRCIFQTYSAAKHIDIIPIFPTSLSGA